MPGANLVNKFYFHCPSMFEEVYRHRFSPECEFLAQVCEAQGGILSVLDVACGTGAHAAILSNHGYEVPGIDRNANMLETESRLFFPREFRYFLESNGFKLVDFYSAFYLEEKTLYGSRLISVSTKESAIDGHSTHDY